MKICISGFTACGKTTLLRQLARHYRCSYISFSSFLLKEYAAIRPNLIPSHKKSDHYWYYAKSLNHYRSQFPKIEKQIDKKFYNLIASKEKIVFDSFTYPYLATKKSARPFCVFLKAEKNIRVERALRCSRSLAKSEIARYIDEKDGMTNKILRKIWKLNIFRSSYLQYFDLVIDDGILEKKGVAFKRRLDIKSQIVMSFAELWFYRKSGRSRNEKVLVRRCRRLLKRYYPIVIKKYPLSHNYPELYELQKILRPKYEKKKSFKEFLKKSIKTIKRNKKILLK